MGRGLLPLMLVAAALAYGPPAWADTKPMACVPAGVWVDAATGEQVARGEVIARAAATGMVVLGETHNNPEHHLWEYQTIAALHARGGAVALGFEMFPRRVQPALDAWVAGELDARAFLEAVEWDRFWGFDAALYMPLFDFARINRLPMIALNVGRDLIASVRERGWAHVPEADREGVSDPAPPDPAYRDLLNRVYQEHLERRDKDADTDGLERFIDVQLTWDRAMAEALAAAAAAPGKPLVIGVLGGGHVENGYGVPHQLAALGRDGITVLLPWDRGRDCAERRAGLADAVFGLDPPKTNEAESPWRPRLGVVIKTVEGALRVLEVVTGSAAEAAGIEVDDAIVTAAGVAIVVPQDLVTVIGRQAPGTWLPLTLERNGETHEVIAKFPGAP